MRLTYNQIETFLKPIFLLRKIYKHSIQNDNITPIKKTTVKRPLATYARVLSYVVLYLQLYEVHKNEYFFFLYKLLRQIN